VEVVAEKESKNDHEWEDSWHKRETRVTVNITVFVSELLFIFVFL